MNMNMASDFFELQREELDAIRSYYGDDRVNVDSDNAIIKGYIIIELEALSQCSTLYATVSGVKKTAIVPLLSPVKLLFQLPAEYPSALPSLELECEWMSYNLMSSILKKIGEVCSDNLSMPSLYFCCTTVIDEIKQKEKELSEVCLDDTPFGKKYNVCGSDLLKRMTESIENLLDGKFENGCFDCEVCLESKMGRECIRFTQCNHIFCQNCVSTFFLDRISNTQVRALGCLSSGCISLASQKDIRNAIGETEFDRYERLLLDSALDQMNDMVICPRRMCQSSVIVSEKTPNLGCCDACGYSFCVLCGKAYHGVEECKFREVDQNRIIEEWESATEMDKLAMSKRFGGMRQLQLVIDTIRNEDWIKTNSKKCPRCCVSIEKNDGCNKMHCTKCNAMFCWLCDRILNSADPYSHFSDDGKGSCFNRLFEGSVPDIDSDDERYDL